VKQQPESPDTHISGASPCCRLVDGQWGRSPSFETAVPFAPDDRGFKGNLGSSVFTNGNFDTAISQFESAAKLAPQDATLHYDLGLALNLKDNCRRPWPNCARQQNWIPGSGCALHAGGDALAARATCCSREGTPRSYSCQTGLREAYYTLGTVLKQNGDLRNSVICIAEAIRMQPEFAGARITLAAVLRQLGDSEGAAAESRAGMEIDITEDQRSGALFANKFGAQASQRGRPGGRHFAFRAAISSSPNYAAAHLN